MRHDIISTMDAVIISIFVAVFGLLIGSFSAATVWRLRAQQLKYDKVAGESVDRKEYKRLKPLTKATISSDRSRCLDCQHQLAWYDLIPLFSWLSLGGKCRYCRKPIGWFEPVVELSTAIFFVVSYIAWPLGTDTLLDVILLALWLIAGIGLVILFWYDAKWFYLPDIIMLPVIGVGLVYSVVTVLASTDKLAAAWSTILGCAILSGLYFLLYQISRGRWVGFGDIKLGLALALLLADWKLALLTLFLANVIGCLIVFPLMVTGRIGRTSRVPFGPMLIGGWIIAGLFGTAIIDWYLGIILYLPV